LKPRAFVDTSTKGSMKSLAVSGMALLLAVIAVALVDACLG
jgi:hypothetical protein